MTVVQPGLDEGDPNKGGAIGVPKGYRAPGPGGDVGLGSLFGGSTSVKPRYFEGDEYNLPGGMNRENIQQIQEMMLEAGLITESTRFSIGGWNKQLATIFKDNVLGPANQRGMSARAYLRDLISRGGNIRLKDLGGGGKEEPKAPYQLPVRQFENVDDLRSTFKMTASKTLGRNITDEEANSMVMSYRQIEMGVQDAQNNAEYQQALSNFNGATGQGAPVDIERPPDPNEFANRVLREKYGGEAAAVDLRNVLDNLGSMIRTNPFKQGG